MDSETDFVLRPPQTPEELAAYFDLRWRILRAPWNQPRGSEKDEFEQAAVHLMALEAKTNELAGVGRLHFPTSLQAQVRFMAVAPEWRGKGVGGLILGELERLAREKRVSEIVLNGRENAIQFYQKRGYAVEGPAPTLFGNILHFKMRKIL